MALRAEFLYDIESILVIHSIVFITKKRLRLALVGTLYS